MKQASIYYRLGLVAAGRYYRVVLLASSGELVIRLHAVSTCHQNYTYRERRGPGEKRVV